MRKWYVWMLIGCLLAGAVAFYLSWLARPTEADAIKMIRERGGHFSYRDVVLGSPITEVNLGKKSVSDADLKALRGLTSLIVLNLEDTQVTDAGLRELKEFKELTTLTLAGTQVTDAGLKELTLLKGLTSLDLRRTRVTDSGLKALAGLPRLNYLKLHESATDATLHALAEVDLLHTLAEVNRESGERRPASASEVRSLNLGSCREVTDDGLKVLAKLPNLVSLSLSNSGVTDAGMKHIRDLPKLTTLALRTTGVTSKGLRELRGLTQLTTLYLEERVTNETLEVLIELDLLHALLLNPLEPEDKRPRTTAEIRSLSLRKTGVTYTGLKLLKKLPNLKTLDLGNTQLTEYGLEAVRELKQLESLDLSDTDVTDKGLKYVKELTKLSHLNLFYTRVTDAGLKELQGLTQLKTLNVPRHLVTDRSLQCLADAGMIHALWLARSRHSFRPKNDAEVDALDLEETRVTAAGLKGLKNLKQLKDLMLDAGQVTDAALATLAEYGLLHAMHRSWPVKPWDEAWSEKWDRPKNDDSIRVLNISGCAVTDECLKVLTTLKSLRSLYLDRTHVTDNGLKAFRAAMPECYIGR